MYNNDIINSLNNKNNNFIKIANTNAFWKILIKVKNILINFYLGITKKK